MIATSSCPIRRSLALGARGRCPKAQVPWSAMSETLDLLRFLDDGKASRALLLRPTGKSDLRIVHAWLEM